MHIIWGYIKFIENNITTIVAINTFITLCAAIWAAIQFGRRIVMLIRDNLQPCTIRVINPTMENVGLNIKIEFQLEIEPRINFRVRNISADSENNYDISFNTSTVEKLKAYGFEVKHSPPQFKMEATAMILNPTDNKTSKSSDCKRRVFYDSFKKTGFLCIEVTKGWKRSVKAKVFK